MMRFGRKIRLFLAVLACLLFCGVAVAGEREAPRREIKGPKKEQVVLKRDAKPVGQIGKWSRNFSTGMQAKDCAGACNCTTCVCWETLDDPGCCDLGCSLCWIFLDAGNNNACFEQ